MSPRHYRRRRWSIIALTGLPCLGAHGTAHAQVSASWLQPLNGQWTGPANWSSDPAFPNNGTPAGATYDVTIGAEGQNYAVTLHDPADSLTVDTLELRTGWGRFTHLAGTLTLGRDGMSSAAVPLRLTNGGWYTMHGGTLHLATSAHVSQIGAGGWGRFDHRAGTVVQRGHLAVGIGGGSLGSGTGMLQMNGSSGPRWLRDPSGTLDDLTVIGVGPQGTGSLTLEGQADATFSTLSVGAAGGRGTLYLEDESQLTANRLTVGNGAWSVAGSGTSGFGVATLDDPQSRITLTSLTGTLPGVLAIGGGADGAGGGTMIISAGFLSTALLSTSPTGVLDVRGGLVELATTSSAMSGTVLLSGTGSIHSVAGRYNLSTGGQLHISGGTFITSRLTASNGTQTINVTGGSLSVGTFTQLSGTSTFSGASVLFSNGMAIGGTARFTLAGGSLTTSTIGMTGGTIDYTGGTLNATALDITGGRFTLAPGADLRLDVKSFAIDGPGTLDLNDNPLTIDYAGPSPADEVRADIRRAYAFGAWSGAGITSSMADATAHGLGYVDVAGATVVVRLTRYGDANLDRVVNLADFNALAQHFGSSAALWSDGDFNYDGVVNLRDFNALAANFGLVAAGARVTPEDWANLAAAVPEPSSGLLVTVGFTAALWRRRRRRRRD